MRGEEMAFLTGLGTIAIGTAAMLTDHFVYHADLLDPSRTPHSAFFPLGVALVMAGGATLLLSLVRA